jgi:hypothetical protein
VRHEVAKPSIVPTEPERSEVMVVKGLAGWAVELPVGREDELSIFHRDINPPDDFTSPFAPPEDVRFAGDRQGPHHVLAVRPDPPGVNG